MQSLSTSKIRIDGGTQPRVSLNESVVSEYAEKMGAGEEMPPIDVFHDGSDYWLADGFHRFMAALQVGSDTIVCTIHTGTKRDAILHAVGSNSAHGLPRTNEDKRRAVKMLLDDEEWSTWSAEEIARRCLVSATLVKTMRRSLDVKPSEAPVERTYRDKHGNVSTMRTENIGKRPRAERIEQISELAEQGHRAAQIASQIGVSEVQVRRIANEEGIELPDKAIGKVHRLDNRRVIEQTVLGLDAAAAAITALPVSFEGIDASEAAEWAGLVAAALHTFRQFHRQLTEASNG